MPRRRGAGGGRRNHANGNWTYNENLPRSQQLDEGMELLRSRILTQAGRHNLRKALMNVTVKDYDKKSTSLLYFAGMYAASGDDSCKDVFVHLYGEGGLRQIDLIDEYAVGLGIRQNSGYFPLKPYYLNGAEQHSDVPLQWEHNLTNKHEFDLIMFEAGKLISLLFINIIIYYYYHPLIFI